VLVFSGKQLLDLEEFADAEPLLGESLAFREKLAKPPFGDAPGLPAVPPWQVANARSLLSGALLGQEKYSDAEPLLLAAVEGLKKDEKLIPPQGRNNIAQAMERLVRLYEATGKTDGAGSGEKSWQRGRSRSASSRPSCPSSCRCHRNEKRKGKVGCP
jgi:hypothetical protein